MNRLKKVAGQYSGLGTEGLQLADEISKELSLIEDKIKKLDTVLEKSGMSDTDYEEYKTLKDDLYKFDYQISDISERLGNLARG